ncbi:MAG: type II secretion system protein [Kiritimatiellae bacterium]|nr:type II secretion system protein [Kiritimatiellia bacterium]
MQSTEKRPRQAGFSLTELMFTIGAILVLAGMVFPATGYVQNRARRNVCLNNLRQWGMALGSYLDDHGGVFPSWDDGGTCWYNVLPPYVGVPRMSEMQKDQTVPTPGGGTRTPFLCPADRGSALDDELSESDRSRPYSSYAANIWLDNPGNTSPYTKRLRMQQLRHPSTFVVLAETGHGSKPGVSLADVCAEGGRDSGFRHHRAINMCFADGSAGSFPQERIWREGLAESDNYGGLVWNPNADKN